MFKHVVPNTVLRDWLGSSVLGPTTEPYLKYLTHHGYAACTIENYLPCVAISVFNACRGSPPRL
jgi:hypothetical protein